MNTSELKSKLTKSLEILKNDLAQIRTGRANPGLVEGIAVEAYGSKMTVKELGSVTVLDAQILTVSPWDKNLLKDIAKAITESDLKINAVVDGNSVRVPIPALTEDRRKEFAKIVSAKVEDIKNSMRNVRQDAMKDIEKAFTDKSIGEDDKFSQKEEVEKIVKEFVVKAEELGEAKKTDIMKIG